MFKSVKYVLKENLSNLYRIYSIAKYELVADIRDSRLGLFWNFANPTIQILTYWFVFGILMERKAVNHVPFIQWLVVGMVVWFFMNPCITNGCNAVFSKTNVITKMKFPVSILPATVILKELFNHFFILIIMFVFLIITGFPPSFHWLGLIYYCFCAFVFGMSLSLVTSVLNMLARDTRKLVLSFMRLLLYLTPILWPLDITNNYTIRVIMKFNPIYYIVTGYRDCMFYHHGVTHYWHQGIAFWSVTIILLLIGSAMMYKFKHKLIDMI